MASTRFVAVSAAGVLAWITRTQRSRERDLVEHLIARDADQAIDLRVMARHQEMSVAELGRILFALNRSKEVLVSVAPPAANQPAGALLRRVAGGPEGLGRWRATGFVERPRWLVRLRGRLVGVAGKPTCGGSPVGIPCTPGTGYFVFCA